MTHSLTYALSLSTHSADFRDEDGSDDNRSSSLGRSAPSDDASVASDYQDDGAPECELTIVLILCECVCDVRLFAQCRGLSSKRPNSMCGKAALMAFSSQQKIMNLSCRH